MKKITLGELLMAAGDAWTAFPGMGEAPASTFTFEFSTAEARDAFRDAFMNTEVEMPGGIIVRLSGARVGPAPGKLTLSGQAAPDKFGLEARILDFLRQENSQGFTAVEIARALGTHQNLVPKLQAMSDSGALERITVPSDMTTPTYQLRSAAALEAIKRIAYQHTGNHTPYEYLRGKVTDAGFDGFLTIRALQVLQGEGRVVFHSGDTYSRP